MYTAGVLSGEGYETLLVSGDGWPDGVHTWVLVGILLGAKTAWIPVEATPEAGHSQQILGRIPSTTDATGKLWFDSRYVSFGNVIDLPPNLPPVAKIRPPVAEIVAGESTRLLAITSVDPDGEIVLYKWDFGDGRTRVFTSWSARHEFKEAGNYTIQLIVIDNGGKNATTSLTVNVVERDESGESSEGSDCGCGS